MEPILAVGTYALGSPIVHFAHGNPRQGFESLGLRLALPVATGFIGFAVRDCGRASQDDGFCGAASTLVGIGVGVAAAVIIDAAALAWKEEPRAPESARAPFEIGFAPSVSADGKRGELRAYGFF